MISIIIPVFNGEKYISRCLASLTSQSYGDLEIIVVDDGSNDKTESIVKQMAKEDRRIRYFYKKNGGVSSARNYGLNLVNGEYITFIDSDDYIQKDYYQNIITAFEPDIDVVISNFKYVDDNSECISRSSRNFDNFIDSIFSDDGSMGFVFNKTYRKSIIGETRFNENIKIYEDLLFNVNLSDKINSFKYIDSNYYMYYQNDFSAMHTIFHYDESRLIAEKEIICKLVDNHVSENLLVERMYYFIWDYNRHILSHKINDDSITEYYEKICGNIKNYQLSFKMKISLFLLKNKSKLFFFMKRNK